MKLINRSGQDIEYRVSGGGGGAAARALGGATAVAPEVNGWAVLDEGEALDIPDSSSGSTLEVRVTGKKPTEVILDAIDDLIEVGRNLKVKILKTTGSGSRR